MINLSAERLLISDHTPDDLEPMHRLLSNPVAMFYLPDIKTSTIEDTSLNLNTAIEESKSALRKKYYFKMSFNDTHQYIGEIGYTVRLDTPLGKIVNLGYFILPEFWGKGLVAEAAREVIRFAFEEDDVIKVETGCLKENKASEKVMIKLGMIKEADYRKRVWHDNSLKDRVEYRLLKEEWLQESTFAIRKITEKDKEIVTQLTTESWGSSIVVSKGIIHDVPSLPGFIVESKERIAGLITYSIKGNECEIVTLESFIETKGIGTRLIEEVIANSRENKCNKVWLVTTNDNIKAIRFYQKRGFDLVGINFDSIKRSREIKPQIPLYGFDGIPILHEIEFEKRL